MIYTATVSEQQALEKIFWETSAKNEFRNEAERAAFRAKYFDNYFFHKAALNFYAQLDRQVLGYVFCVLNTASESEILQTLPYIKKFAAYFNEYPAHLHINLTAEARNQGIGTKLIDHLESKLQENGVPGVHLMTAVDARNVSFYLKNGYQKVSEIDGILMLGKVLC